METTIMLANIAIQLAELNPRVNEDGCVEIQVATRYGKATATFGYDEYFGWVAEVRLPDGKRILKGERLGIDKDGEADVMNVAIDIREFVRRITTKRGDRVVNPITHSNGQATWLPRSGDMFVVTGTRCDGQRFTLTVKSWAHARAINVWRGSKWLLRDGKRWLIQRINN